MSLPDGEFVIVVVCGDCGKELNRSKPLTHKEYTQAVLAEPMCTGTCPNGCRSTFSDLNLNTRQHFERVDGTRIEVGMVDVA